MNMQELLTYVEELTFKTSMFGYDKDEVDIQLDKICDEAEAIILAKEKEIEELKKESKTALGIAAAATGKTMEELEKDTQEDIVETEEEEQTVTLDEAEETVQETVSNEVPISTVAVADADEAQDEIETVRAQLVAAQKKVAALEAEIAAEKEKTEKAIARAEEAEKSAENNKAPETTDQAYERYMKNADLLCKQLSDLEGRQNAILDEAREQAEREREKVFPKFIILEFPPPPPPPAFELSIVITTKAIITTTISGSTVVRNTLSLCTSLIEYFTSAASISLIASFTSDTYSFFTVASLLYFAWT